MASLLDLSRILVLIALLVTLLIGRYRGNWDTVVQKWRELEFTARVLFVVVFIWPLSAFVSPLLLRLWNFLGAIILGLGGEYLITRLNIQLLLIIIAFLAMQTAVLVNGFKQIERLIQRDKPDENP